LDNAVNHSSPLILSRYCGIGSHRYPLGFSGDTFITWDTLHWLPEFTATASNIGYTWWSHDIGGHFRGEKNDEMYLRHIQFGVFSPINRLHCGCEAVQTKEPWAYGNGAGELIKKWMRFRHSLIPYLYSAAYRTHRDGLALVEPLYYEWDDNLAYQYKNEYLFGGELLVIPVTQKAKRDGFAHIKAWLPQGKWTDIFTGAKYDIPVGGKELVMFREMESIPVLIKEGGILPLSVQKDNSVFNPLIMEIDVYAGSNKFILYEDGAEKNVDGELFTHFETRSCQDGSFIKQMLEITTEGKWTVVGKKRKFLIRFKDIEDGEISVFVDNKEIDCPEVLTGCVAIDLDIEANKKYTVSVVYKAKTQMERVFDYALKVLICGRDETLKKGALWMEIIKATTIEEYIQIIDKTTLVNSSIKERLKEII
jgi:alpha-glucosidase (family GH31 glycosyl hydrolase)